MEMFFEKVYFSYRQLLVYDRAISLPGCAWTPTHSAQGFARRDSVLCFNTLMAFGTARLGIYYFPYIEKSYYDRVISVPFGVVSGEIEIAAPDDCAPYRKIEMPIGEYRLTCAQYISSSQEAVENDEGEEVIDLYFEALDKPLEKSEILVADETLNPPAVLLETADVAGED